MYSYNGKVSFSKIQPDLKMAIPDILNALQDACMFQSDEVGRGTKTLLNEGKAWFLQSWHVKINRRPAYNEEYKVCTWPYDFKGFWGYRNFQLEDTKGNALVQADTKWFFFDLKENKPLKITPEEAAVYELEPSLGMQTKTRKIKVIGELEDIDQIIVSPNYLDSNYHVNNGQYVRLASNYLPLDFEVTEFRTEFPMAAKIGDTLYVKKAIDNNTHFVILANENGQPYSISEFTGVPSK